MGANSFLDTATGKTAREAFDNATAEARYQNGHGGYSGTLAEKTSFTVIPVPAEWAGREEAYADHLIQEDDDRISDKWGPAGVIAVPSHPDTFIIFGWASS